MASSIRKNSQPKQLFIGFAGVLNSLAVKRLLYPAEIPSLSFPKEHCCRYVPGEAKARNMVAAMKETSLYAGNTDATATSLASVSEKLCVQLSMPKKPNHPTTQSPPPEKQHERFAGLTSHQKVWVPKEFKDFVIYDSGTEDSERILIFAQQTLLELLESTQHLWLADGTFELCPEIFCQLFTIHTSIKGYNPPCIYALLPENLFRP